jgi:heme oxygenase
VIEIIQLATNNTMTLQKYKEIIQRNYLIHSNLESQVYSILDAHQGATVSYFFHSKLEWLEKDMEYLGIDKPRLLDRSIPIPKFKSISDLYGYLYVVEGSMLGGRILYPALRENKDLAAIPEFHFFKNYGSDVGLRWKTFKNIVEDENDDPAATTRTAISTFRFYETVFQLALS